MASFDEDRPVRHPEHELGADLSSLSLDELDRRIALLKNEIVRLEEEKTRKQTGRQAAASLFKN